MKSIDRPSGRGVQHWIPTATSAACLALLASCSARSDGGLAATEDPYRPGFGDGVIDTDGGLEVEAGDAVAVLTLDAPQHSPFVLRATLPVPKGTYPRADGQQPFALTFDRQSYIPIQTEIVSRYAADADGADVVEILAVIELPEGTAPGDSLECGVVLSPHPAEEAAFAPEVAEFLSAPGSLVLSSHDVHDNVYKLDLLTDLRSDNEDRLTKFRDGHVALQERTYGVMTPDEGSDNALPHMMGVHAYVTQWRGMPFFSLDLRINNGPSNLDPVSALDDVPGKLYFEDLTLKLPAGWKVVHAFEDPVVGNTQTSGGYATHPIVKAQSNGDMHFMPPQAQFHRRLIVVREGFESHALALAEEEGRAFCRPGVDAENGEFYSWWNKHTARYFPQKSRLPDLAHVADATIENRLNEKFQENVNSVRTGEGGNYPSPFPAMGWAHPWGIAYGGMHGGDEIYLFDGLEAAWAGSRTGYRLAQLTHRRYTDRQRTTLYDLDGEPTRYESWIREGLSGEYVPCWFFLRPLPFEQDPFGYYDAPNAHESVVQSSGRRPAYEADLDSFDPIDLQHYVRYTRAAKVLAWLGNDALAKDDLKQAAEVFRFSYHEYPVTSYGHVIVSGMQHAQNKVAEHPGRGLDFGRGEGWGLDSVNAAYSLADPEWRASLQDWYGQVVDLVEAGQMECTGTIMSQHFAHMYGGEFNVRQSIEAAIVENALKGTCETVYAGKDEESVARIREILIDSFYSMVSEPVWDAQKNGPNSLVAVAPANAWDQPFCTYVPPEGLAALVDTYQVWSSFAYAYRLTGDPLFLTRAEEMAGGTQLLPEMVNQGLENLRNRAALLALLQEL